MRSGIIHRLIALFDETFDQLQVHVEQRTVEDLAVMVHKAMTFPTRNYHNLAHVFKFLAPSTPIQTLAALFHDLVYYQVDRGFLPEIGYLINPYVRDYGESTFIISSAPLDDLPFWLTAQVFNFEPGKVLTPLSGLNEFLSALVMNLKLHGIVTNRDLLITTLCVEATIPFRKNSPSGDNHFDRLVDRLPNICHRWNIDLSEADIVAAIQAAVRFANLDVDNFAEKDPKRFLDGTWKLLPEMNPALRSREVYSIREYRQAIENMETFLSSLDPNDVFHSFRGYPPPDEFAQMVQCARHNVRIAQEYLRVKLLSQAILEALAEVSGGDAPLSLFMGDLPAPGEKVKRLEDFLPELDMPAWIDAGKIVYNLLAAGRTGESNFDLKTAPLSQYLYKKLPPAALQSGLDLARRLFSGDITAKDFLANMNPAVVSDIARATAAMVNTRHPMLSAYILG